MTLQGENGDSVPSELSLDGLLDRMPFSTGVWKPSPDIRPLARSVDPRTFAACPPRWEQTKRQVLRGERERHVGYAAGADRDAVRACLGEVLWRLWAERPDEFETGDDCLHHLRSGARWNVTSGGEIAGLQLEAGTDAARAVETDPMAFEDSIALTMAEDITVVHVDPEAGTNRLEFVHVCFPSLWDPSEKLGMDFAAVHRPVANSERLQAAGMDLMSMCRQRGPFIRWAWGLHTDDGLNHHPVTGHIASASMESTPEELAAATWLRLERQILLPQESRDRVVFLIGVFVFPLGVLAGRPGERAALADTIRSMDASALSYKSLTHRAERILTWLDSHE